MTPVPVVARTLAVAAGVTTGLQLLPALTTVAPLRRALLPRLAGSGQRRHVALTFDDGPDRVSTPRFLDLLAEREVTATFFLLGAYACREPVLVREMAAAGHELAVHGWEHDCIAMLRPGRLAGQLARSKDVVENLTGRPVAYYRPPYGVMTAEGLYAARRAGLETVLWSAWGGTGPAARRRSRSCAPSTGRCDREAPCCCTTPTGPRRRGRGDERSSRPGCCWTTGTRSRCRSVRSASTGERGRCSSRGRGELARTLVRGCHRGDAR